MPIATEEEIGSTIAKYAQDRAVYQFSGSIDSENVDRFIDLVQLNSVTKVAVFLTTHGGDADGAYRIIRHLQKFQDVRLLIAGRCKSAGTLLAVGANSIAFRPWGELGPLDIQMAKPDEIFSLRSGLDVLQALAIITQHGFNAFRTYLVEFLSVDLSTKTASEIAATIASRLFEPIAAQVNPMSLAEAERAIKIAMSYGTRVESTNLKKDSLHRLVHDYPSHSFVIDKKEAATLFNVVDDLSPIEANIALYCQGKYGTIRYPKREAAILDLGKELTKGAKKEAIDGNRDEGSNEEVVKGKQGNTRRAKAGSRQQQTEPRESVLSENGRD